MRRESFCLRFVLALGLAAMAGAARAQVNSGSDGSDGAFNPTASTNIDMSSRPSGIYQYTSVSIPSDVNVSFTPNANNRPVVWLVQSNVVVNGGIIVSGRNPSFTQGGVAGPGGWNGGNGGSSSSPIASPGLGPGGGSAGYVINSSNFVGAGQASFGTLGSQAGVSGPTTGLYTQPAPGPLYGNAFLIPFVGGSGGGGYNGSGGGGGGGAILIAANGTITINGPGNIRANGGDGAWNTYPGLAGAGGGGSGGAIRLVAAMITGKGGEISADGGMGFGGMGWNTAYYFWSMFGNAAGSGRIRFDTYQNNFGGAVSGSFTQGSQFIILPASGQSPQLQVASIGGITVSASPGGILSVPDAVLSAQQSSPMPVVVNCSNLPLHSLITVSLKPMNGPAVNVTCYNDVGTLASSSATASVNIPRGGGLIYAAAATGN